MILPESMTSDKREGIPGEQGAKAPEYRHLPPYAAFLLLHKLEEFNREQIRLFRQMKVPFFRQVASLDEEALLQTGLEATMNLLNCLARPETGDYIDQTLRAWVPGQITGGLRYEIIPEDIMLLGFIRRKLFRDFLFSYTTDIRTFSDILEEMDLVVTDLHTRLLNELFHFQDDLSDRVEGHAHIGHWVLDAQTDSLTWSDEMYRIHGMDPGQALPGDLDAYSHPEDQEMVREKMKKLKRTLEPIDLYYRIILKDRKEKLLHARGHALSDRAGQVISYSGTVQDVTLQKTSDTELESKKSQIQKIADLTPSIITAYNIHTGKYYFINRAFESILGYDPEVVLQNGVSFLVSIVHPDDLPGLMEENARILALSNEPGRENTDEIIAEFQYRMRHRDGHYIWFKTYGTVFTRNMHHLVEDVLNITVNVNDQVLARMKLTEKINELRENEDRYRQMIDQIEDYAIIRLSRDGIIENWNKGAQKIKGYREDEIIGKHFRIFYPEADQSSGLPELLLEKARIEGKATHEGWRVRKDGSRLWGYVLIAALHDESGQVIAFSKITRDLTEKKEAEDKLKEYARDLHEKNLNLGQINKEMESFSYIAGHDLQEPLRKIKTFSTLILDRENESLSGVSRDYFGRIIHATERMHELIEALFAYSRISNLQVGFENTDLNLVLEESRRDLYELIRENNAAIEAVPLPVVRGIPIQLQQLFSNILANSIKYAQAGIPPHITIGVQKLPAIQVVSDAGVAEFYEISFSDNGIGFELQYAERIFEPFQRLHGKLEYSGTGIGLAICKKIVQAHKGFIRAKGEPGRGSTFLVYLPVS